MIWAVMLYSPIVPRKLCWEKKPSITTSITWHYISRKSTNHCYLKITELSWTGPLKAMQSISPAMNRDTYISIRFLRALCSLSSNVSRGGTPTITLDMYNSSAQFCSHERKLPGTVSASWIQAKIAIVLKSQGIDAKCLESTPGKNL